MEDAGGETEDSPSEPSGPTGGGQSGPSPVQGGGQPPQVAQDSFPQLLELLRTGGSGAAAGFLAVQQVQQTFGLLPPPAMLREYEEISPGFAERLMAMVERQQDHRHQLEDLTVRGNERRANWGIWIGAGVVLLVLAAAVTLSLLGHETVAAVIGGLDIVGLATVFVVGRREQRTERLEKARIMGEANAQPGNS